MNNPNLGNIKKINNDCYTKKLNFYLNLALFLVVYGDSTTKNQLIRGFLNSRIQQCDGRLAMIELKKTFAFNADFNS